MDSNFFSSLFSFDLLIQTLIIVGVAFIGTKLVKRLLERVVRRAVRPNKFSTKREEMQREDTLISILDAGANVVIWLMAVFMILGTYGVSIGPLLAGAGVVGVALGFGAQSLVKDYLAGIFILFENQYRVGDVLQVNEGVAGVVEFISLRMTTLRDLDGKVHYIPNGYIDIATNMTMEYANVDLDVGVGYDTDIDKLEKIIETVGNELFEDKDWKGIALEPATMLRVNEFADSAIMVKIICKTAPIRQWEVKGELMRRLKKAFEKEGIEIPYPQRVIHEIPSKKTQNTTKA